MLDVLMATYNGAKHLDEQVQSILSQSDQNFRLIIADDASTDNTPLLLKKWANQYPDKIELYCYPQNAGPCANFSRLIELSDADYMMFSDQDDIWEKDKVALSMKKMKELELQWGDDIPLMVASDLSIIDEKGRTIGPSWKKFVGTKKGSCRFNALLCRHAYLGCTLLINKELAYLASPIPVEAGMHDYWISLVAAAFGKIGYLDEQLVRYRLHEKNVVGAHTFGFKWFKKQIQQDPEFVLHSQQRILRAYARAFMFYQRYKAMLNEEDNETITNFLNLKYYPFYKELYYRIKGGFLEHTFWQNIALLYASWKMGAFSPIIEGTSPNP